MSSARILALTSMAMIAFACNSLLCRLALKHTPIDAASFTAIRLTSGAAVLWLIVRMRRGTHAGTGNWQSVCRLVYGAASAESHQCCSRTTQRSGSRSIGWRCLPERGRNSALGVGIRSHPGWHRARNPG